ncbi:MAG: bifunctional 2-polyprenyl-6-hydroxyphenol methylase/3-demethylubiquinol 3-O-methyltransferase UbiG [Candidatus Binatia bacterium]
MLARMRDPAQINNRFYEDLGERWYEDDVHPIALLRAESNARLNYIEQVARARIAAGARILDLGCGAGFIAIPLARKGYDVKGIDISESSLAVARRHVASGDAVSFAQGNVSELREDAASYDAVLMMDLLEHLERPEAAIHQASRALKPGGLLIFHTFNRTLFSYLVAVSGIGILCRDPPRNIHVHRLFIKPEELRQMCARAGLKVNEFVGIRPRFMTKAFGSTLLRRRVHPGFDFRITRSIRAGYLGYAVKSVAD